MRWYILFQDNTLRNQARFPNKLGDYLGMNGFILSNCVGDLKFFVEKDMGVIKIERENDVKIFLSDFIVGKNENRINKEVLKKNTWQEVKNSYLLLDLYKVICI